VFERFTQRARQVVVLAQDAPRTLKHNYIGTEHILLGLVRESEGVATRLLLEFRADGEKIRNEIIRTLAGAASALVWKTRRKKYQCFTQPLLRTRRSTATKRRGEETAS
jgi:ATP-dependent Clp protease ATP-binding subunit ClpA